MRPTYAAALALGLLGTSCGGSSAPMPKNVGVAALAPSRALPMSALPMVKETAPPGVDAHPIAGVPEGSMGPFSRAAATW